MTVIRISYELDSELKQVLEALAPLNGTPKLQKQKGRFKRCYIKINSSKRSQKSIKIS